MTEYSSSKHSDFSDSDAAILAGLDFDTPPIDTIEQLTFDIYAALRSLEERDITPDEIRREVTNIPFGKTGDSRLSGELSINKNGANHGHLQITSPHITSLEDDDGEENIGLPRIIRDQATGVWTGPLFTETVDGEETVVQKRHKYRDIEVVRELERRWPWGDRYDNTHIRDVSAHPAQVTTRTIFDIMQRLSPYAETIWETQRYIYAKGIYQTALEIERVDMGGGMTDCIISLQRSVNGKSNGAPVKLVSSIKISDRAGAAIESYLYDTQRNKTVLNAIGDQAKFTTSLTEALAKLIDSKTEELLA